jgi:hypothetical protein
VTKEKEEVPVPLVPEKIEFQPPPLDLEESKDNLDSPIKNETQ